MTADEILDTPMDQRVPSVTIRVLTTDPEVRHRFGLGVRWHDEGHSLYSFLGTSHRAGWLYAEAHALEGTTP